MKSNKQKPKEAEQKLIVAYQKLEESEERFKLAMKATNDGLFDWNLKDNSIYFSPGWKKMLGYEDHELSNVFSVWENLTDPEDVRKSLELTQKLIAKDIDRLILEFKMKHKAGHWVDVLSRSEAIFDATGVAIRIVGTHTDVTERNKAEIKLKDSQNYLSAVFNNTQDAQLLSEYEGYKRFIVVAANKSYINTVNRFGLNVLEQDLVGKNLKEVLVDILHLDEEVFEYTLNYYQKVTDTQKQIKYIESIDLNDKPYHSETSYTPIHKVEDETKFVLFTSHDITKETESYKLLRKSEETHRLAMEATTDGLWDWDVPTGHVYFNPAYARMLGEQDIAPKYESWGDRIHPDDKELILRSLNEHMVGKKEFWQEEHRLKTKSGKWKWVLGRGSVVKRHTSGQVLRMVGTMTDISERKKTESEMIKAKNRAEESDRLKSAFLANMSHEIRTPMNGILGFADLLKGHKLRKDKKEKYIDIIEKSGNRMLNIINDIIDISKIESGLVEVELADSNINEQMEYIHTFFKPEVEEKGIKLNYKNELLDNESIITTDREKLFAILTNLVKNAIKYTTKGTIEFGYNKKGDELEFYVRDTGYGIASDRIDAIFERFIQADIKDVMARQGVGLGLSITKSYIEMLGGKIWVKSEEGVGSIFYFTLPYQSHSNSKAIVNVDKRRSVQ
ncbi:PAS domain-containing protein [Marinifilum sp. N1E240]|uniref:PAS domain-containing protein n=1 Tax=Marinifilum sp. N1E240 TaxID=2608082 RepID=UPI00128DADF0|nr:PAS domain-containing protein [Marinifilum sp. N1E240]MPQ45920.1 PAS domain-containing protein [Marinifilum sp. N1E240]